MSEYTPTTDEVREAIAEWAWSRRMFRPELAQSDGGETDRWFAAHDAEVRAGVVSEEPEWEYRATACEPDTGDIYDSTSVHESPEAAFFAANEYGLLESNDDLPQLVIGMQRRRKAGPWVPVKQEGTN